LTIGQRLKELRDEKGITQVELAKQIGVAQNTYANYENENRNVPDDIKIKLAEYHKVSLEYLMGISKNRREAPFATVAAHSTNPLGDLTVEEQDELLDYLEMIRKRKTKGK